MSDVLKHDVERFVYTLEPRLQQIWEKADDEVLQNPDTLSDEFQIAAQVTEVFWNYVKRRRELQNR